MRVGERMRAYFVTNCLFVTEIQYVLNRYYDFPTNPIPMLIKYIILIKLLFPVLLPTHASVFLSTPDAMMSLSPSDLHFQRKQQAMEINYKSQQEPRF